MTDMDLLTIKSLVAPFLVGALVVGLLGTTVRPIIVFATCGLRLNADGEPLWARNDTPGKVLGYTESALFYIALLASQPIGIAGYLGFKVAAKWQNWAQVIKLPAMPESKNEKVGKGLELGSEAFDLRQRYASWLLIRFLLGSILNVLIAIAGVAVFTVVKAWLISRETV